MEIPISFFESVGNSMVYLTTFYCIYLGARIYNLVIKAHQKQIYNTINYENCQIYPEKMEDMR